MEKYCSLGLIELSQASIVADLGAVVKWQISSMVGLFGGGSRVNSSSKRLGR